jgi:hypothetical protein
MLTRTVFIMAEEGLRDWTGVELEIRQLGHWRRIGRAAYQLASDLDAAMSDGNLYDESDRPLVVLSALTGLDATVAAAEDNLGAKALPDSLGNEREYGPEVSVALDLLYRFGPLARSELRGLTDEDRDKLSPAYGEDEPSLDDKLRGFVDRTRQWQTAGASATDREINDTGQPGEIMSDVPFPAWSRYPEGPRQVRRAAIALFHYLADDRFLAAEPSYEPPYYAVHKAWHPPGDMSFLTSDEAEAVRRTSGAGRE